ncbi:hypothetical protein [Lentzea aerocolonigenes]|uniref:hypothetical protein n=1 Tax=Lentzea aerocolonigenes TaxID=68170 RepID=UPI00138E2DBF|nr:hypothetical protein [Lentzea aerocolonigenes]
MRTVSAVSWSGTDRSGGIDPLVLKVVVLRVRVVLDMTFPRFARVWSVIDGHAPAGAGVAPGALPVCAGYTTMDASFSP